MKYETTPAFDHDVRHLSREHRLQLLTVLRDKFIPACDAYAVNPARSWPRALRVKSVRGSPGLLEMACFFASPDGRATVEFVTVDGELRCRWGRVGDRDAL